MSRLQILLSILLAVLIVLLFWFLVFSPRQDDLAQLEMQIEDERVAQAALSERIAELRAVRENAPSAEAQLAAGNAIISPDPGLPAALRQLQSAADESGLVLRSISSSRPAILEADLGIANIALAVQLEGGYFQVVDFLRRVEDPTITPRAVLWTGIDISIVEHPELLVSVSGNLFTRAEIVEIEEEVQEVDPDADPDAEDDDIEDDDVDLDAQSEQEAGQ